MGVKICHYLIMTDPLNVCTNQAYLNSVDQKIRFQLFNKPPTRYDNLANSPYDKINPNTNLPYTKFDLDMRRKAEILKYSSSRMSTQTNNLTKAEKFAQAVNGYYQQRTFSQAYLAANTQNNVVEICPPGVIVKTPTSASDVPGPIMMLYDDPTIPLYNLINTTNNSYGILNVEANPQPWDYTSAVDVIYNNAPVDIFTIFMINMDTPFYIYSFVTPISISFEGVRDTTAQFPSGNNNTLQLKIDHIEVTIYYSYSQVTTKIPVTSSVNTTPITISLTPGATSFSGSCYMGLVNVSNIMLPASLGYIYDIKLSAICYTTYPTNSTYLSYYKTPTISAKFNITSAPLVQQNCLITNNPLPVPNPLPTLTISGYPYGATNM